MGAAATTTREKEQQQCPTNWHHFNVKLIPSQLLAGGEASRQATPQQPNALTAHTHTRSQPNEHLKHFHGKLFLCSRPRFFFSTFFFPLFFFFFFCFPRGNRNE